MTTLFKPCKCSTEKRDEKTPRNLSAIPIIGLVNGLSGGHKGEKVQLLLNKRKIPTFDLFKLSTDEAYFKTFVAQFSQMYDDVIMEELKHIEDLNTDDTYEHFHLHPRILIGGGDGSTAWALSVLDRVILDDTLLTSFWRRACIMSRVPDVEDNLKLSIKQRLGEQTTVSTEFYYSKHYGHETATATYSSDIVSELLSPEAIYANHSQITPLDANPSQLSTFNFDVYKTTTTYSPRPRIDTRIIVKDTDDASSIPQIQIDLCINERNVDNYPDSPYSSSSSSAQNEEQIVEEFMNQELSSTSLSPKKVRKLSKKPQTKDEVKYDNDHDSLSESLVTREELQSVIRQKEYAAISNNKQSIEDLRILQGIYDCRIAPCIALVPLGTGNDLSRCLGTGFTYPGSKELTQHLISEYKKADITKLDRWKIVFLETEYTLKKRLTSELLCYFSIGFEGQIAYKFQCARSKNPKLFDRPWRNKMQYLLSGIGAGVEEALRITKPLNDVIECYVDGEKLKLPSNTRSLVVSNIQSMADGVYFWGKGPDTKKDMKQYTEPNLGDGKLEVMAAKGIYKYLQMRMGLSHYRRLAQPKRVTIIMKQEMPIQVDGESWIESKGIIQIYLLHQVFAVVGTNEPRGVQIV